MLTFLIVLLILSLIIQSYIGKRMYEFLLNPIFLFNIIFFLHNWSFSFSRLFDDTIDWNVPYFVSKTTQEDVLLINLTCLWAFFVGYIISYKRFNKKLLTKPKRRSYKIYSKLYIIFTVLFLIKGFATNSFFDTYGEGQALSSIGAFNPIDIILDFRVIFGSVVLINLRKLSKFFWFIIILELIISVLTGGRKGFVIILASGLLANFEHIKVNFRKIFKYAITIVILMYMSSFIAIYRSFSDSQLSFTEKITITNKTVLEDGTRFFLVAICNANSEGVQNWTYQLIEDQSLQKTYGLSYLQAIVNTVILRPFQGELADYQAAYYFKSVAYPDIDNNGWDFSFTAESILNWGQFAFITSFVLGIALSKIYFYKQYDNYYNILYFVFVSLLYINLRTDSTSFFRNISVFIFSYFILRKLKLLPLD